MIARFNRIFADIGSGFPARKYPVSGLDIAAAIAIGCLAVVEMIWAMGIVGDSVWKVTSFNLWFEADTPRVIANLTDSASNQYRSTVHPMAAAMLTLPVVMLEKLGLSTGMAARTFMAFISFASAGLCFLVLRLLDLPRVPAVVFTAVFLASASFIHWAPVPELNSPAMLTILVALVFLAHGRIRNRLAWTLMSAATMGITITNWSVGVIATLARFGIRRCVVISAAALALVLVVAVIQTQILPGARIPSVGLVHEYQWTQVATQARGGGVWDPFAAMRSLVVTTVSASSTITERHGDATVLTNQRAGLFDRTPLGIAVALCWIAVLGCGVFGGLRGLRRRSVAVAIGLMIAFQAALHSVYGDPTFLYAPHFLPLLIVVAAWSWFTPLRWMAVGLAAFVAVAGFIDNAAQFRVSAATTKAFIDNGGNPIDPLYPAGGAVLP